MKNIVITLLSSFLFLILFGLANAYVNVDGYFKSNGTYVEPYVRSEPNGLKYDNYGYKPSQGLYNDSYGTRDLDWDTPTWNTDPDYYTGKSIYDSNHSSLKPYNSYSPPSYSPPKYSLPKLNSFDDSDEDLFGDSSDDYDYSNIFDDEEDEDEYISVDSYDLYKPSGYGLDMVNDIISSKNDYLRSPDGFREDLIRRLSNNYAYNSASLDDARHYVYSLLPDIIE